MKINYLQLLLTSLIYLTQCQCLPSYFAVFPKTQYGRGRMAGGWKRRKWVFGMLGVRCSGKRPGKPVLRLVERRTRRELVPIIAHHARRGSSIISDEWRTYRNALPQLGYRHYTVNHSVAYVDPETGAHTQHIERAWRHTRRGCGEWGETAQRSYLKTTWQSLSGMSGLLRNIVMVP